MTMVLTFLQTGYVLQLTKLQPHASCICLWPKIALNDLGGGQGRGGGVLMWIKCELIVLS